jgi:hypothetical protein
MRRAVALVHVQVDHPDPQQPTLVAVHLGLHQARGHRHVVEHAVARALVGVGMVRAPRQVGSDTFTPEQRDAGRADRGPHRSARAFDHGRRPREADLALLGGAGRALHHGGDPAGVVRQRQFTVAGRQGRHHADGRHVLLHRVAQQPVLAHREGVAGRQRQHEGVGVEGLHRPAF